MFDSLKRNLTPDMSKADILQMIELDKKQFRAEIKSLIEAIKDGMDKAELIDTVKKECENTHLIQIVNSIIASSLGPYEETQYLRQLDFGAFKILIDNIFNNTIIQIELRDVVRNITKLDDENIDCSVKLLNTLIGWIIVRRYSLKRFKQELHDMFRFDEEKANYLWELYNQNRKELIEIALLDNITICKGLRSDITKLVDLFSKIFEEEEENSESPEQ